MNYFIPVSVVAVLIALLIIDAIILGIVVFLVIPAIVIPTSIFKYREKKEKEQRMYNDYVYNNSECIKQISKINEKYEFNNCPSIQLIGQTYDNKTTWKKIDPESFLIRELRNNLMHWKEIEADISENKRIHAKYREELNSKHFYYISKEKCLNDKMNYERVKEIEKRFLNGTLLKPTLTLKIMVRLRYISKGGNVDELKEEKFDYEDYKELVARVSKERMDRQTYEKFVAAERGAITDSMRYDVLRRDGFKCVLCGASAKDGVRLQVDHIMPVSKGGRSVMSNLRTLCERCNTGKSNKIE